MKKTAFLLFSIMALLSCEPEEKGEPICNPDVLAYTASVSINEENVCYQRGGLGFNNSSNILSLILFSPLNSTGAEIDVQFSIPAQGLQFDEAYNASSGEYSNAVPVTEGTITLTEDNYPQDPNLLQYKGTIDLTFQSAGSGNVINVSGTFSFEQP